ncbi:MAG: VWA domain-containing protein [Nanoarchaeota archaeon]
MKSLKKTWIILPIILIALLWSVSRLGKRDDWVYSHTSVNDYLVYGGIVAALLVFMWIGVAIYMIIRRKGIGRQLGVALLVIPPALVVVGVLGAFIQSLILMLGALMLFVLALLAGIIVSIWKQQKIALIPLLAVFLIIPLTILSSVSIFSRSAGMLGNTQYQVSDASRQMEDSIGFSVGGAKDIENFRANIQEGYLPVATDITYEGAYYDYMFDTGESQGCDSLFCPVYSYALSKDPFSQEEEHYLQVGLESGMAQEDFARKKLNLVIVLDISGSMGAPFSRYYYDDPHRDPEAEKSKMRIASESVVDLLGHLDADDRFGMVLFESQAHLAKPLGSVGTTDMQAIKDHILEIHQHGGTNMAAGMEEATKLFDDYLGADKGEYENRIIFLTDAMLNQGVHSEEGLFGMTRGNADNGIHTTFIGVGVDFNTELVEEITKIRGANYYSVHSAEEFKTRMDDEFEYMVTPLVFDLGLRLDASGFEIEKVYGSPEADEATGQIMKVNTLFPSAREDGETKGGIVILKLRQIGNDTALRLTSSYEDREGVSHQKAVDVDIPDAEADHYANSGIRKGILLARYVNVMRNWIAYEQKQGLEDREIRPAMDPHAEIVIPPEPRQLGRWERQSKPLVVSEQYSERIAEFRAHFLKESEEIGDPDLDQEAVLMESILAVERHK